MYVNGLSPNSPSHSVIRAVLLAVVIGFSGLVSVTWQTQSAIAAAPSALQPCGDQTAPGETMTCQISAPAEVDTISLNGTVDDVYLFRLAVTAGTMRPQIRVTAPDGATVCQSSSSYNFGVEIARCVLTQTGTQTISISDATATRTGSYNLYVQRLNAPVNPIPLAIGETHTQVIATGAEATSFSLTGTANEAFLLRMGVTAGDLRPSMRVTDTEGSTICAAVQPYAPGVEITRCVLPQTGTYTVLAADSSLIDTGSYNLYVQRLTEPVGATLLDIGATHTATIQAGSEADTYTLTGAASDVVLLRMSVTAGNMRPSVRIFNSDGSVLCQVTQPYAPGVELSRCVLPQDGTYTVLATDTSAVKTGSYNLYVQRLSAPVGAAELAWGTTAAMTLQQAAELHSYSVQVAANDVLLIRVGVSAGTMRPVIKVFDPGGVEVCAVSGPYSPGIELTRCLIPRDGTFLIVAGDTSATKVGVYHLYIQRLTAPAHPRVITTDETLIGSIEAHAEADTLLWSAGANDRLRLTVATTGGNLRPGIRIFDPAGTKICEALSPYSTSAEIADCILPRSGVYTILVGDATATKIGTYRVGVTCLTNSCGAPYSAVIGPEGGQVIAGELQITIPSGAFAGLTTIQVTPQPVTATPTSGAQRIMRSFAILARDTANEIITTAAQPLTYTLYHGDLELATQKIDVNSVWLALWSEAEQQWHPMTQSRNAASSSATRTTITDVALLVIGSGQPRTVIYLPLLRR